MKPLLHPFLRLQPESLGRCSSVSACWHALAGIRFPPDFINPRRKAQAEDYCNHLVIFCPFVRLSMCHINGTRDHCRHCFFSFFKVLTTLSKKKCMLALCMPEPRQFKSVKGRQLCRYTDHAYFTYAATQAAHFIANIWLLNCNL